MSVATTNLARMREWYTYILVVLAMAAAVLYFTVHEGDLVMATLALFGMFCAYTYWKDLEV